jgi:DNA-binding transcriptional LysR family regulator
MSIELRHLRYFVAVAEELHFSRAAQRLHISQPPLSQHIKAVESELGVLLLRRTRRRVELTEAGARFLEAARTTLEQAERAMDIARRIGRGESGTLRLGFTATAPFTRVFTQAVRAYRAALPGVHLELALSTTAQVLEAVRTGALDVGLVRPAAGAPLPAGLRALPVLTDRLMLVLPADHPLAARPRPVPVAALADEPFVLRPQGPGSAYYEQVFRLCQAAGFTPRIAQEAQEAPTILALVAAGMGVSILPAALRAIGVADVLWRPLAAGREAQTQVLLVFSAAQPPSPLREGFVTLIQRFARRSGAAGARG